MTAREPLIAAFLEHAGWSGARRARLAGDASFRKYDRLVGAGGNAVLMDAPPPMENVQPFIRMARHLARLGLSAPRILAEDVAHGLLLLEDLGDATYTRLLAAGHDEDALYRLAVDVLIAIHARPATEAVPADLPAYDDARLLAEAALLVDWYLPALRGHPTPAEAVEAYRAVWARTLAVARRVPDSLVLRDYHVDNLMLLEGRRGIAACGLLDFQDAVAGPIAYDFVSLVEDARRDIDPRRAASLRARYLAAFPALAPADFDAATAVLGAQRHCKVIGIFTRLAVRDGKPDYLVHIPRVWRLLDRALAHPALAAVRLWIDREVPAETRIVPPGLARP
ncbi:MAG: aminoglycoside phosphotransferase [Alphaproteobacteria bacterium]|nr:aminoglycoside phosphotransferase [Alphaproteobacteria bacterium]